jgi:hypothetical protein
MPDESLDLAGIAKNVRHFRDALGLKGIFCNRLMGEGWSLLPSVDRSWKRRWPPPMPDWRSV